MIARKLFICSAIAQCQETVNCCAHKQPHIKDERCIPRECRYAPAAENIDCVLYEKEKPVVPVTEPVVPVKQVNVMPMNDPVAPIKPVEPVLKIEDTAPAKEPIPAPEEVTQEINIKAAVKKQASTKKKGRK